MNVTKLVIKPVSLICLMGLLVLGGCGDGNATNANAAVNADGRCEHQIKAATCPFCNPTLVNSEGFCGAHGFPEAICAQCKPGLKVAFRAQGDWCDEHKVPESQCIQCNPALAENIQEGVHGGAIPTADGESCEHGIAEARCPFCNPSLVDSEGFCQGHGVPEALCVKCRPFMKTAFVANSDWCSAHNTPESQCKICNP